MAQIKGSGHCFTFPSSFLQCCLAVFITIGLISRTAAENQPIVTCVTPISEYGDSPLWYDKTQRMYFIDGVKKTINRYQPDNKEYVSVQIETAESLKFLVPFDGKDNVFIVGFDGQIGLIYWDGKVTDVIKPEYFLTIPTVPGEVIVSGKADSFLRLWIGTKYPVSDQPDAEVKGKLYMVDVTKSPYVKLDNIGVPTGVAWDSSNAFLYYVDSSVAKIVRHSFTLLDGNLVDGKVFYDFKAENITGVPNGITVDTDGNLWVSCMKSSLVVKIDPNGVKLTEIDLSTALGITNVVFGGPKLDDLYVTTAADPSKPESGALFYVTDTGSTGMLTMDTDINPNDVKNFIENGIDKIKGLFNPIVTSVTPISDYGDSPLWYDITERIYFIDGSRKTINRYQPDNNEFVSVQIETVESLKFLVPFKEKENVFIVGYDVQIGHIKWDGTNTDVIKPEYFMTIPTTPGEVMVSGKSDSVSRLWIGTSYPVSDQPGAMIRGRLYMVEQSKNATLKLDNIGVPTGVAWDTANAFLYYVDSSVAKIVRHSYTIVEGNLLDYKIIFDFIAQNITGVPNGITVDADNNLWVTCMKSSLVLKIDPNGVKLREINLSAALGITNVAFGGRKLNDLYLTSAPDPTKPESGALFCVTDTGSTGISPHVSDVK